MNTSMPSALRPHYRRELEAARQEFAARNYVACWRHLELAHRHMQRRNRAPTAANALQVKAKITVNLGG